MIICAHLSERRDCYQSLAMGIVTGAQHAACPHMYLQSIRPYRMINPGLTIQRNGRWLSAWDLLDYEGLIL